MRIISTLVTLALLGYGVFWLNQTRPELKYKALEFVNTGSFHTLEVRYTAEQIMSAHKNALLKDDQHSYLDPALKFHPYLLMEVKFTHPNNSTGEGVILWDLMDGEMVINEKQWEKSHGFADCINANTERYEFKVINLLAQRGGSLDREGLIRALHIEDDILDSWIDSCRKKKLIVQSGNDYRLHLEKPNLNVIPITSIDAPLVTKSYKNAERIPRRYSPSQIKRIAEASFGKDFAIRNTMDVYLPIHSITVQNPDGSLHTSHWNALNGKALTSVAFIE